MIAAVQALAWPQSGAGLAGGRLVGGPVAGERGQLCAHVLVETSRGKTGTTTVEVTPQSPGKLTLGVSQLTGGVKFS